MCFDNLRIYVSTDNPMYYLDQHGDWTHHVIYHYCDDAQYVADAVQDAYISWRPEVPVFISAQTGCGKNYFVQHQLVPTVMNYNMELGKGKMIKRVLFLSNRVALNRQNKIELAKSIDGYLPINAVSYEELCRKYSADELDQIQRFDCVDICSYHQLLTSPQILQTEYAYVIIDEAHFFTQDSMFNYKTDVILEKIVATFSSAIRIYMSATFDDVFLPIIREEEAIWHRQVHSDYEKEFKFIFYDFPRRYNYISNIKPIAENPEKLVEKIHTTKEKWLVFVANKAAGETLTSQLGEEAAFICSETKSGKRGNVEVYNQIVEKQTYKPRILVATAVIDNGISLKDSEIRHVAIFVPHPISFIQMLGRIRIQKKQKITLYVPRYSAGRLQKQLKEAEQELCYRLAFDCMNSGQRISEGNRLLQSQGKKHPGFGLDEATGEFTYSALSKEYLISYILALKSMLYFSEQDTKVTLAGVDEQRRSRILNWLKNKDTWEWSYTEARLYKALSNDESVPESLFLNQEMVLKGLDDEFFGIRKMVQYRYKDSFDFRQCILCARLAELRNRFFDSAKKGKPYDAISEGIELAINAYNQIIQPTRPFDSLVAQTAWLGKLYRWEQETDNDKVCIITKEALRDWCQEHIFPDAEYEKASTERQDALLLEYGFDGIGDDRLETLKAYMKQQGETRRQQRKINDFLETEGIPYHFVTKKIGSTKANTSKGKSYWVLFPIDKPA